MNKAVVTSVLSSCNNPVITFSDLVQFSCLLKLCVNEYDSTHVIFDSALKKKSDNYT